MGDNTSIRIGQELYERARHDAAASDRSISAQIEFWARVGCAALDNPDLPVGLIAQSVEPFDASGAGRLAAVEAMRQVKKIRGVRGDDVAAWIAEGRQNDLGA